MPPQPRKKALFDPVQIAVVQMDLAQVDFFQIAVGSFDPRPLTTARVAQDGILCKSPHK